MSGGFEVYGAAVTGGSNEDMVAKFKAVEQHVVETVDLGKAKTVVGVVSSIIDLGSQELPDSEFALTGEDAGLSVEELTEKYAADVKEKGVYFAEGYNGDKKTRELMKKVPQKPRQCVAISIDFPSKVVDKGQFFGESKPAPLRIWYGGKFWNGEKMVIQNLTPLKVTNLADKGQKVEWSLNPRGMLHKMAVAAELIDSEKEAFLPARIDELLGKAFLFSVQVTFEEGKGKNAGKQFYKEKVKFTGALMDGMETPTLTRTNLVMMKAINDEQAIVEIPKHVRNTIEQSVEYPTSKLKEQFEALDAKKAADREATDEDEVPAPTQGEIPKGNNW